jgi:hypothetical protein
MAPRKKHEVITFKVDDALSKELKGIPNRSAFIRSAILAALDSMCPLCRGTGILTPNQKRHWDMFSETHPIKECGDCLASYIVCNAEED